MSAVSAAMTRGELVARDGLRLATCHQRLAAPRARIAIVHGYAEHGERYARLMEELAARGHECHLFELRGHGASQGRRGHVDDFAEYRGDLDRFLEQVPAERARPRFLLGHSLGGLIALDYAMHRIGTLDGLIVASPFLAPGFRLSWPQRAFLRLGALAPRLAVPSGLRAADLSHDAAEVAAYVDDPRIFSTVTLGWMRAVRRQQEEISLLAAEVRLPSLFLVAGADRIADPARSRDIFARSGASDREIRVYPELFHELFHEVEKDRAAVVADLLAWLDARAIE